MIPQYVEMVKLKDVGALARLRLLSPQPGDPYGKLFELFLERRTFPTTCSRDRLFSPNSGPYSAACCSGDCSGMSIRFQRRKNPPIAS